jgi:hypothetical protein
MRRTHTEPGLTANCTYYIIPQPNPDGAARISAQPTTETAWNLTPYDDDHDGDVDEDGPEDLNGDGLITMMRVTDPTGGYVAHPLDSRVLIPVRPELGEHGQYALYVEGVDNDTDEQWNEDGAGGVDFNRNLPYDYPFFSPGAGDFQVSEPETKAIADWLWEHHNIAAILTLGGDDNLHTLWPAGRDNGDVRASLQGSDEAYYKQLAEQYKTLLNQKGEPVSADGQGSLLKWAYFDLGLWAFGVEPWWIPETEQPEEKKDGNTETAKSAETTAEPSKPKWDETDKRGSSELKALKWLDANHIDSFVPWTVVLHPDFPGKIVEVGGFKPYAMVTPPPGELDKLAPKEAEFATQLGAMLPHIELVDSKVEPLGNGLYRVTVKVVNTGRLPTISQMGNTARVPYPLQLTLDLPQGGNVASGNKRELLPPLAGGGGSIERSWIVHGGGQGHILAYSPCVGSAALAIELGGKR